MIKLRKYLPNRQSSHPSYNKPPKCKKIPGEILPFHFNKSRTTVYCIYFALKYFYKNVFNEKFGKNK